ncbi:hypothetical protein FAM09_12440 [Niastella caeni]|uniref:Calcineurin-like phosphoesterase domain-containing protein n=1 Tax=Niastella caeni TaxID=2569763 RepID=A0A4S8HV82_9BACT|nr:metallophosphoesterase [Niastella caeni]THU39315.1 hypothetical protein FAM09_12440 [Niastella caeni]
MRGNPKFALVMPSTNKPNKHFSVKLKERVVVEKSDYRRPNKLFVLSGIEGNLRQLCKLLMRAKVVDKYLHWTFEDNHLVLIGNCFNSGDEITECLWLVYSLEEKAKREGGHVHFILGNNEIMGINGNWRHLHPHYAVRKNGSSTALYDGNNQLWKWLCTKNIIERIGDMLFVYGGMAKEVLHLNLSVKQINDLTRPHYTQARNNFSDPVLSLLFGNDTSPFGYRGYCLGTASEELVDATLQHFDVQTIITGHPLINRINTFYNGKVFNVNMNHTSGISEGLLISKDRFYRVAIDKKRERIK